MLDRIDHLHLYRSKGIVLVVVVLWSLADNCVIISHYERILLCLEQP